MNHIEIPPDTKDIKSYHEIKQGGHTSRCCRISVLDYIEIPPDTKIVVLAYVMDVIDRNGSGVIETDSKILQT